jgi:glyoxylase-like metal-dependent hydrolase (beta-lactamase superfamily II)
MGAARVERVGDGLYLADLGPLDTYGWMSTYIVVGTDSLAIVDPGPRVSAETLVKLLESSLSTSRARRVYIVLTHIHIDHSGAVGDVIESLPGARVLVHPRGVKHLVDPSRLWQSSLEVLGDLARDLGEPRPVPPEVVVSLEDGATVDLGGLRLLAIHTPGHSPHHISYLLEPSRVLFAGDSIANCFNGRAYPVTVPPFSVPEYLNSLKRMVGLRPSKIAVSHYGIVTDDPEVFIQRAKDKLYAWIYQIEKLLSRGIRDPETVYAEVLREDLELAYAKYLEDSTPTFRGATYRAIKGLLDYLLRSGAT